MRKLLLIVFGVCFWIVLLDFRAEPERLAAAIVSDSPETSSWTVSGRQPGNEARTSR